MTITQRAAALGAALILTTLVSCAPDVDRTTSLAPETSLRPLERPATSTRETRRCND